MDDFFLLTITGRFWRCINWWPKHSVWDIFIYKWSIRLRRARLFHECLSLRPVDTGKSGNISSLGYCDLSIEFGYFENWRKINFSYMARAINRIFNYKSNFNLFLFFSVTYNQYTSGIFSLSNWVINQKKKCKCKF